MAEMDSMAIAKHNKRGGSYSHREFSVFFDKNNF